MINLSPSYFDNLDDTVVEDMHHREMYAYINKFSGILDEKIIEHYERTHPTEGWRLMDAQKLERIFAYSQKPLAFLGGLGSKLTTRKNIEGIVIALNHSILLLPLKQNYDYKNIFGKNLTFNHSKYALLNEGILFRVPEKIFGEKARYTSHFLYAREINTLPPF